MAAIGGVSEESPASSDLYFWTMSKSGLRNCRLFACDGDLECCFDWPVAAIDND